MEFKDKLRALRKERGWTQPEAAKLVGVSLRAYKGYELGERHPARRETYLNMADVFNVDLLDLMDSSSEFILEVNERHGEASIDQAEDLIKNASALFAGGDISEGDKEAVLLAIQEAFFKAKEITANRKRLLKGN
ncbi:helix-turn-helix domain-containing protein [Peptoniphilus sp. GNH]|nr:DNA-binding helix-turn-helix protein [Clostridiales bacterium KA00134]UHR03502.1 helix-turn-helix domain-containing protein [Peptoniphilus sp. GNH]